MRELINTAKVIGWRKLFSIGKTHKLAWGSMINGYFSTRIFQTLLNVGVLDEMMHNDGVNPEKFAKERNLDNEILKMLCDTMYSFKYFNYSNGIYSLSPDAQLLTTYGRGWFEGVYGYGDLYNNMEDLLSGDLRYGKEVNRRPKSISRGSAIAEGLVFFPLVIEIIKNRRYKKLIDLGCGEGTFLRQVCTSVPELEAVGIDISGVAIDEGIQCVADEGLSNRITLHTHDVTRLVSSEQNQQLFNNVEIATSFFVLHEIAYSGKEHVVEYLRGFRRTMPGVPLIVFEVDRLSAEKMRSTSGMAPAYILQHLLSHQRPLPKDDWKDLFIESGFTNIEERNLSYAKVVMFTLT